MWELLSPLNGAMFLFVQSANRFGSMISDAETLNKVDAIQAHERLLDAIQHNDLERACAELDRHYEKTGKRVYRLALLKEQGA